MRYNILCSICARGGSKGVKNKNIRLLNKKPLIAYTIEQAKKSNLFEHIVISTDSEEIANVGRRYGAEVFFKRDKKLSTDTASKIGVYQDVLKKSEEYYNKKFDFLLDLDATSPLRDVNDIKKAFNQFILHNNDNLLTAMPSRRSPYFNLLEIKEDKVRLSKESHSHIRRRQDSPKCYDMNASIYIWKRDVLLNNNSLFLDKTGLYIMPEERSIDIDTEIDFKIVEILMKDKLT